MAISIGCRFWKRLRSFAEAEGGTALGVSAFSFLVLATASGVVIDAGRGYLIKSRLTQAVDSAALAGGRVFADKDDSGFNYQSQIQKYFSANFPDGYLGINTADARVSVVVDGSSIKVSASVDVSSAMMSIVGLDSYTVSSSATVSTTIRGLEIAMILDNSSEISWLYMDEMKKRAKGFLDAVSVGRSRAPDVNVAVVPFAARANVKGQANINAETPDDPNHVCMDQRPSYHAIGETDPTTEPFDHYSGTYAPKYDWSGYKDRICPAASVTPLTQDREVLDASLDSMEGRGCRRYDLGMAWGWRTLSPDWQDVWQGQSVTPPVDYEVSGVTKVAIIGTMGSNTPRTCSDDPETIAETEKMFLEACEGMKREGIVIYAITYINDYSKYWDWDRDGDESEAPTPEEAARALFEDCTSGQERAFFPQSRDELEAAISSITNDMVRLQLSK